MSPGDGADVYFSSNLPMLPTSAAYLFPGFSPQRWILTTGVQPLRVVAGGPVLEVPDLPPLTSETILYLSDYYILDRYDVSSDGAVTATVAKRACIGGSACLGQPLYRTTVHAPERDDRLFDCEGWLSRNGRYLLCGQSAQLGPYLMAADLLNGQQNTYVMLGAGPFASSGRAVADNGTFLIQGYLVQNGQQSLRPVTVGFAAEESVIDALGQVIVYSARPSTGGGRRLRLYHVATSQDTLFLQGNGDVYAPAISADGNTIAFLSTVQFGTSDPPGAPQLYVAQSDGSGFRSLTGATEPSGVLAYTMSDDGKVGWYVSGIGRLVKVDLATGASEEKIPNTPQAVLMPALVSRGSAATLQSIAVSAGDSKVKVDDLNAPIVSADPGKIVVQIPWEVPVSDQNLPPAIGPIVKIDVDTGVQSVFNTRFRGSARVMDTLPRLETSPIHEDWNGFVTPESPAHAGEIISYFATGLGPVTPTVATGSPGPSDPPATTVTAFVCNANVLFTGLAPGLIGYYQVSIQIPLAIAPPEFDLSCEIGNSPLRSQIPVK